MKKSISLVLGILTSSVVMASSDSNPLDNVTMNIIEESGSLQREDVAGGLVVDKSFNGSSEVFSINEILGNESFVNGSQETILDAISLVEFNQGGLENATHFYDETDGNQDFFDDTPDGGVPFPGIPGSEDSVDVPEDPIDFPFLEDPDNQ